jgi:protein SCO1/2
VSHPFGIRTTSLTVITLACLFLATCCGPSRSARQTDDQRADTKAQAKDTSVKPYHLTGRVVSVDKPNRSINVDGDEIPGFMAAMTMPYQVKDSSVLDKVAPGDLIKAEIVVGNDGAYLENIVLAQKTPPPNPRK